MIALFKRTLRLLAEERGAAITEYAIVLALVIVAAVGAISGVGQKIDGVVTTLNNGLSGVQVRR